MQPRGNAAAQDAMPGGDEGWQEVQVHVPFRDDPVKLKIPIGTDGSIPLEPNTPLGRGAVLSKAALQLDTDGHLEGGSVTVKLTKDLSLGSKSGPGVTLKGGDDKELSATLKGDELQQAKWSLDAEIRKGEGDKIADLSMTEVVVRFGEETLFTGGFDVKSVEAAELLKGTIKIDAGGGLKGKVTDNEPEEFEAQGLTFALDLPGIPKLDGGSIGWLSWDRTRGNKPWDWFWFKNASLPNLALPNFGFPFARLAGTLKNLSLWNMKFGGEGDGLKWKWPNLDLDISLDGFDLSGIPIPRFSIDPSGLFPKIPFTPSFNLFKRGGDGKPWFLFNKLLKGRFPLPRGMSVPYEVQFAVNAGLDVGLKETEVALKAEMEEYAFDPRSPALPNLTLGMEVPETNVVQANAWGKAVADAVVPGKDKPAYVGLRGKGHGEADLNAATKASAKLKVGDAGVGGAANLGIHTKGGVDVGFDLSALAHVPGLDSMELELFSLGEKSFSGPFTWDEEWDAAFGNVPMEELGAAPLVDPKNTQGDPGNDLGNKFDENQPEVSSDPKKEVEPKEGGDLLEKIKQMGNLLDLFGDLAAIFTTVEAILTDWGVDAGSPKDMILDLARKKMGQAETLVEKTTSFYDKVEKAEKNGLFQFLEDNFPGGTTIVDILKGYLKMVDATYKGISWTAGALGGTDYEAQFKAMDEAFYASNVAFNRALREERKLVLEGYDWKTANKIILLEYKAKVRELDSAAMGQIDPQPMLWYEEARRLRELAAPKVAKAEGYRMRKFKEFTDAGIPDVAAVELAACWRLDYVNCTGSTAFSDKAKEWEAEVRAALDAATTDEEKQAAAKKWAAGVHQMRVEVEMGKPASPPKKG